MNTIAVSEFKATCLKLLDQIKKTGHSLIITKKGEPIAMVCPPPEKPKPKTAFGCMQDTIEIVDDIIEPLPSDDWEVLKT